MHNPFSIDLEDWYQGIELPLEEWKGKERRVEIGMDRIIEILYSTNSKCTFFTLGVIGEEYPKLIQKLADAGHEIASHGYSHKKVYDLTPDEFREELKKTKDVLEQVSGQEVVGHRSPFFSITKESLWALEILKECGFEYDCSISPIKTWRYGISTCPEKIFKFEEFDLIEYPVNTFKFLGKKLGIGGAYFRIFPYLFFSNQYKNNEKSGIPTMFYAHPWEYDPDHPIIDFEPKAKFTHYHNLKGMFNRTKKLLNQFQFSTVKEVLKQQENNIEKVSIKILEAE